MKRAIVLMAGLLVPGMALAEAVDPMRDALIAALRENGCQMTPDQAIAKVPGLRFEEPEVQAKIFDLADDGVIEVDEQKFKSIRLHAEGCPEDLAKGTTP